MDHDEYKHGLSSTLGNGCHFWKYKPKLCNAKKNSVQFNFSVSKLMPDPSRDSGNMFCGLKSCKLLTHATTSTSSLHKCFALIYSLISLGVKYWRAGFIIVVNWLSCACYTDAIYVYTGQSVSNLHPCSEKWFHMCKGTILWHKWIAIKVTSLKKSLDISAGQCHASVCASYNSFVSLCVWLPTVHTVSHDVWYIMKKRVSDPELLSSRSLVSIKNGKHASVPAFLEMGFAFCKPLHNYLPRTSGLCALIRSKTLCDGVLLPLKEKENTVFHWKFE